MPSSEVTGKVRAFYEENPFPNYDEIDSAYRLIQKAEAGFFARMLNREIPVGARVLEVGCGTGQLSNYLGLTEGRRVIGADFCFNSLRLGEKFRARNEIPNAAFFQMNLFHPPFQAGSFDAVICSGVLHHTADPEGGFQSVVRLAKTGALVVIGLYNRLGRIPNDVRAALFRVSGGRMRWLDARLRDPRVGEEKRRVWFKDQYEHPHESRHTMDEVLGWFDRAGIEFLNSVPAPRLFQSFSPDGRLFSETSAGNRLERWMVQTGMMLAGGKEGGFFIMVGRKKNS